VSERQESDRLMARPWEAVVPDADREVYDLAGLGRSGGLGARPALLVIDVQHRTLGPRGMTVKDAIRASYPTACGTAGWDAVSRIADVVTASRGGGVPVIHAHVAPKTRIPAGQMNAKVPAIDSSDSSAYESPRATAPRAGELVVLKDHSSAFFGTSLASSLVALRVDTLLVAGCTTSGCVRASVVDAVSFNFHVAVLEECIYDRSWFAHCASLFDISRKYGDVVTQEQALDYIQGLTKSSRTGNDGKHVPAPASTAAPPRGGA